MRITFPLFTLGSTGGEKLIVRIANGLIERGHEVIFVMHKGSNRSVYRVKAQVREGALGTIPFLGLLTSLTLVPYVPQSDIVCATSGTGVLPVLLASKYLRKGTGFYIVQHWDALFAEGRRHFIHRWIARNSYRWFDNLITVARWLDDRIYVETGKKTSIINPGIDLETFKPVALERGKRTLKTVLCLGRPEKMKGLSDVMAAMEIAWKKRNDLKLVVVSRRPLELHASGPLEQKTATDQELARLYSSCNVFVLPSWYEGCPAPPLEAMACGAPVVVTDCLGTREYAVDGVNSLVVPPKRPDLLARAILSLVNDESLATRLGQTGIQTARRFTWDRMIDQFEAAFLQAAAKSATF